MKNKILIAILFLALAVTSVSAQSTRSFDRVGSINFGSGSFAGNTNFNDDYGFDLSGNANTRDFTRTSSSSNSRDLNDILANLNSVSQFSANRYTEGYNLNVGDCSLAKGQKMKNKYTYFDKTIVQRNTHGGGPDNKITILRTGCDGTRGTVSRNVDLNNGFNVNSVNARVLTDSASLRNSNAVTDNLKTRDFDVKFNEAQSRSISNSFGSAGRGNLIILNRAFNQY